MLVQATRAQSGSAHVIVLGNEKGGSGKSTTALHIIVALLKAGQRVASIDLNSRQRSLTAYLDNRRAWARRSGLDLELPHHICVALGSSLSIVENEAEELKHFSDALSACERNFDFIVIDTPGNDSYLMRLAHSMADTLITPLNNSFVDFDVLGKIDQETYAVTGESHYAAMAREARRARRQLDGSSTDWIVVRNRLSMVGSRGTRGLSPKDSINCRFVSASARSTVLRNGWSIANSSRAASPHSIISTSGRWGHAPVFARHRARGSHRAAAGNCACHSTSAAVAAPQTGQSGFRRSTSRSISTTSSRPRRMMEDLGKRPPSRH